MALLFIAMKAKLDIHVCHVLHDMRSLEEATKDKDLVENFCKEFNLPFYLRTIERTKEDKAENLEDFYRVKRREHLIDLMDSIGATYIATGHHADDQLETVLMKMCRGCGLKGMSGISETIPIHPHRGCIIRPLLGITKDDCYQICKENSIPFNEDATNADCDYTRNAIRNRVLPVLKELFPTCSQKFVEAAEIATKANDLVEYKAALIQFKEHQTYKGDTTDVHVFYQDIAQEEDIVLQEWLRQLCLKLQTNAGFKASVQGINNFMYSEVIRNIRKRNVCFFNWPNSVVIMVEKSHVRVNCFNSSQKV